MTDWATISALATAGGTLVLAAATFSSVRSSSRSARTTSRFVLTPRDSSGWVTTVARHWRLDQPDPR